MKKLRFQQISIIAFLIVLISCMDNSPNPQSIEGSLESLSVQSSGVDEDTPRDAKPLILNDESPNGRVLADPNGAPGNWNLVWSDEFSGTTLDPAKWVKSVSTQSRNPRANLGVDDWWWVADHAFLDGNGELTLKASKVDHNTMYCGAVETRNLYEPRYGFFEVRMKIAQTAKGNHTAFWFQGHNMGNIDGTGNDGAEIDVFESAWLGNFTKSVVHIDGYGSSHQSNTKRWDAPNIHSGYHTYGLNWTEDKLEVYYDGTKTIEYTGIWVPNVVEWIWLSVGASFGDGDFQSQPNGLLSNAKVDYVRAWESSSFDPTVDYFRLVNKETGKWIKTFGSDDDSFIKQSPSSSTGNWTTWKIEYTTGNNFYFINEGTGKYFRPEADSNDSFLVLKPTSFGGSWTQWEMIDAGSGYYYIRNKQTNKYIMPESSLDGDEIVLTTSAVNDWQRWKLEPVN